MKELISFQEAQQIVLDAIAPGARERVPLADSLGRTLAGDIASREDIPPFDNSAMDGFAVRAADVRGAGTKLRLIGEIAAGESGTLQIREGTCASIMTGAPLPRGADSVIPIEKAEKLDGSVHFEGIPSLGDHVRPAGGDLRKGDVVLTAGRVVNAAAVAVMATLGHTEVTVAARPTVGIVTTGSELVDVGEALQPGKIRDSNGPALAALVHSAGGSVLGPWRARDDRAEIRQCLEQALSADVVLVSGGVSVGEYDLVKDELDGLGMELLFWKVRQRPGKPLAFGLIGSTPVFGLPGNPVSSAVGFEQYVRPALAKLQGRTMHTRPLATGVLEASLPKVKGLHYFARGVGRWAEGRLVIRPAKHQGSHATSSLVEANGLIHLPEELDGAPAGLEVQFEWLDR